MDVCLVNCLYANCRIEDWAQRRCVQISHVTFTKFRDDLVNICTNVCLHVIKWFVNVAI